MFRSFRKLIKLLFIHLTETYLQFHNFYDYLPVGGWRRRWRRGATRTTTAAPPRWELSAPDAPTAYWLTGDVRNYKLMDMFT